jgi:ribose transport system substrate-binding protein
MKRTERGRAWRATSLSFALSLSIAVAAATVAGAESSAAGAAAATYKPYAGAENSYPRTLPVPAKKPGFSFTVADMNPCGCEHIFNVQQSAAEAQVRALGGKFVAMDANADVSTQVAQLNTLLVSKPTSMIVEPLDPTALSPGLTKAQALHIPVVTRDTPPAAGQPVPPYFKTNILQGEDRAAYWLAQALALQIPHGQVAIMGIALPVASLEYRAQRQKYWLGKFGMHLVGQVNGQNQTPTASQAAMQAILAKYPNVQAVMCWDDTSAEAAATAALGQHKKVLVEGDVGDPDAIALVHAGRLFATYQFPGQAMGTLEAIAAYDAALGRPLPKYIAPVGQLVTQAGVVAASGRVGP